MSREVKGDAITTRRRAIKIELVLCCAFSIKTSLVVLAPHAARCRSLGILGRGNNRIVLLQPRYLRMARSYGQLLLETAFRVRDLRHTWSSIDLNTWNRCSNLTALLRCFAERLWARAGVCTADSDQTFSWDHTPRMRRNSHRMRQVTDASRLLKWEVWGNEATFGREIFSQNFEWRPSRNR